VELGRAAWHMCATLPFMFLYHTPWVIAFMELCAYVFDRCRQYDQVFNRKVVKHWLMKRLLREDERVWPPRFTCVHGTLIAFFLLAMCVSEERYGCVVLVLACADPSARIFGRLFGGQMTWMWSDRKTIVGTTCASVVAYSVIVSFYGARILSVSAWAVAWLSVLGETLNLEIEILRGDNFTFPVATALALTFLGP